MKSETNKSLRRIWIMLAIPPFIFLILIIVASIYFGVRTQGDAAAISESVSRSIPIILLIMEVLLLLLFLLSMRAEQLTFADIGWRLPKKQKLWPELLIGSLIGIFIGILYPYILAPLVEAVQKIAGDYVPPGEILPTLGSYMLPFFIANVLLAPFVEENIYRGYGLTRLGQRYRKGWAVLITSVFFGLLHWAGGFWYMLLTGGFLGAGLAALFLWRRNVITPFVAHLVINLIEFIFIWQTAA